MIVDQARCSSSWWRRGLWPWHLVGKQCQGRLLSYTTHFLSHSRLHLLFLLMHSLHHPSTINMGKHLAFSFCCVRCLFASQQGQWSSALRYIPTCHKGKKFPGMNDKERMSRRGVRTKVTPGLCLSLRSHIRHIRSARTLPLSRTVLTTICTFPSCTLRPSLCSELTSVQWVSNYHNQYICNVGTDPAFTVGTSAHPSS